MPFQRYVPFQDQITVSVPDRTWPDQVITAAPAGAPSICGMVTRL